MPNKTLPESNKVQQYKERSEEDEDKIQEQVIHHNKHDTARIKRITPPNLLGTERSTAYK
jgi:hypothetical protein